VLHHEALVNVLTVPAEKNKLRVWAAPGAGGSWINYLLWTVLQQRILHGTFDNFEFHSVISRDPEYRNLVEISNHSEDTSQSQIVLGSNRAWMNFYLNIVEQNNNDWKNISQYILELQKQNIVFNLDWCDIWEKPEKFMQDLGAFTGYDLPYDHYAKHAIAQYSRTCVWLPVQHLVTNRRLLLPQHQRQADLELRTNYFYPGYLNDAAASANYCPLIFNGIYVEKVNQEQVKVSACCINHPSETTDSAKFDHPYLQSQRDIVRRGLPAQGCMMCYQYNKQQNDSIVVWQNKNVSVDWPKLQKLDYNVDPICNAKCISCSSYFSSAWQAEDEKFGIVTSRKFNATRHSQPWQDLDLSRLENLYFNGGEPLLSKEPEKILSYLDSIGILEQVVVSLNTNGSQRPSDKLLELWKKCQRVIINFSIDAIGPEFEYIRNPLKWDQVQDNLIWIAQQSNQFIISIAYTLGIHNIDCVEQTQDWAKQVSVAINRPIDIEFHPATGVFNLANADKNLKSVWLTQYQDQVAWQNIARSVLLNTEKTQDPEWQQYLNVIDHRRNLNWKHSLPSLYKSWKLSQGRV